MQDDNLINFVENNVPTKLAKLVKSGHYPEVVRLCLVKVFHQLCVNKTTKKYLLTKSVVESLIMFILDYKHVSTSLNTHQKDTLLLAIECLCELSYQQRLKIYIPGENTVNEKRRVMASELGVVLILRHFEMLYDQINEISALVKPIVADMDTYDHENQLQVLKLIREAKLDRNFIIILTFDSYR